MIKTIFATKKKMTQSWDVNGNRLPVTVVSIQPLTVVQVKTADTDGYSAVQLGFGSKKTKSISKPMVGHLKKHGISQSLRTLREVIATTDELSGMGSGDVIEPATILAVGDKVDVIGISKGKGYTGVVQRWGFAGGPKTHGQSDRERAPGSSGQGTTPGRVWKGKKMAGRHGGLQYTVKNLVVVKVDQNLGEIWIKGSIPSAVNSTVIITKTGETGFPGLAGTKTLVEEVQTQPSLEVVPEDSTKQVSQ